MRSHLISKVVLKQFADSNRMILRHTKDAVASNRELIDDVAYKDIDEAVIRHLEAKWSSEVEDKAAIAINNLRSGNVMYFEKHISTIKKLIALHFIRTQVFHFIDINKAATEQHLQQAMSEIKAAYPEFEKVINETYAAKHETFYIETAIKVMEEYIPKVEAYINDRDIGFEIGEAPDGNEFIIGDMPVITVDRDRKVGVPITDSKAVGMPLTPKHLVTLKKNPDTQKYKTLTPERVQAANNKQLQLMVEYYYSKN